MPSYNTSFNTCKLRLAHINIRNCRNKEMEISLFLKEKNIDILSLNETWLKSKFELDILNYIITRNDRPRRQRGGVTILVRNNINFDIDVTCSSIDTDNEAIAIFLKDWQYSTSISTNYIPSASKTYITLLNYIKNSADKNIPTLTVLSG